VVFEPSVVVLVPVVVAVVVPVVVVVVPVVDCVFVVPLCVAAGVVDPGVNRLPGLTSGPSDGAEGESADGSVRSVVVSELLVVVVPALSLAIGVGFDRNSVVGGETSATSNSSATTAAQPWGPASMSTLSTVARRPTST
jgi:hypothetical protein